MKLSAMYETEPVGYTGQGKFINAAAEVESALSPKGLLRLCLSVEDRLGRVRTVRWGPRTIDIDVLLMDGLVVDTEGLIIPHPLMHTRGFVLRPLAEIAPGAVHPALRLTAAEMLNRLGDQGTGFS